MISWDFNLMVYIKFKDKTIPIYTVDINFKSSFLHQCSREGWQWKAVYGAQRSKPLQRTA